MYVHCYAIVLYFCDMLILLDIDGVMVPANAWKRPEFMKDGFASFSAKAVHSLQNILNATDAKIVLTTSHKSNYNLSEWIDIFNLRGISISTIDRLPENVAAISRKEEVLNWILTTGVNDGYVIIDDDSSLNDLPAHLKERLILTSGAIGLTSNLAEKAIALLNEEQLHA